MKSPIPELDLRAFTGELQPNKLQSDDKPQTLADFEHLRITAEKHYAHNEPTITWDGAGIAAPGNITGISAAAKAGKTAFTSVLIAGAISSSGIVDGFSNIEIKLNDEKRAIIHFDSEQSEEDQQHNIVTIMKRAGESQTPAHLLSYNIRQLTINEYQAVTDAVCAAAQQEHGGIHMIIIDGGADYITSVNDEEQSYHIVEYFTHLAIKHQCPVIVVVHLNPGSEKERGHFGSQLQRKCYGLVTIKKNGEVSTAEPKIMRKASNDLQPIHYKYCINAGYHVQADAPKNNQKAAQREQMREIAAEVFNIHAYTHKESITRLMAHTTRSQSTCKDYLNKMLALDLVTKGVDKKHRLKK